MIGWTDNEAHLVMSSDAEDTATAAQRTYDAVVASLHLAGLDELYPTIVEVRLALDDESVAAIA